EYPAKIHVRSKPRYLPLIKDRLNEARRSLFRTTCFGPWLDISYVKNDDGYDVKIIVVLAFIEDEEKFSKVNDEDAIRLCLLLSLEIWIIESSCESHRWWTRVPEIIPRVVSCTRIAECLKWEYFVELFDKTPIELSPTKAERQSRWYNLSNDFYVVCTEESTCFHRIAVWGNILIKDQHYVRKSIKRLTNLKESMI
nr:phospholipase-like protein [Tanacetum cinerariifolium]